MLAGFNWLERTAYVRSCLRGKRVGDFSSSPPTLIPSPKRLRSGERSPPSHGSRERHRAVLRLRLFRHPLSPPRSKVGEVQGALVRGCVNKLFITLFCDDGNLLCPLPSQTRAPRSFPFPPAPASSQAAAEKAGLSEYEVIEAIDAKVREQKGFLHLPLFLSLFSLPSHSPPNNPTRFGAATQDWEREGWTELIRQAVKS